MKSLRLHYNIYTHKHINPNFDPIDRKHHLIPNEEFQTLANANRFKYTEKQHHKKEIKRLTGKNTP